MRLTYAGITTNIVALGACSRGYKLRFYVELTDEADNVIFKDDSLESPEDEGISVFCTLWAFLLYFIEEGYSEPEPAFDEEISRLKSILTRRTLEEYEILIHTLENDTVKDHLNTLSEFLPTIIPDTPEEYTWQEILDSNLDTILGNFLDENLFEDNELQQVLELL